MAKYYPRPLDGRRVGVWKCSSYTVRRLCYCNVVGSYTQKLLHTANELVLTSLVLPVTVTNVPTEFYAAIFMGLKLVYRLFNCFSPA